MYADTYSRSICNYTKYSYIYLMQIHVVLLNT